MSDRGQIVVGWLVKVGIVLVVVGLVGFEVVGVFLARATAADTASKAAEEAGYIFRETQDMQQAENAAKEYCAREGAEFVAFQIDFQGQESIVTARKKARTLLIHKIGALKKYTSWTETQRSPLPT